MGRPFPEVCAVARGTRSQPSWFSPSSASDAPWGWWARCPHLQHREDETLVALVTYLQIPATLWARDECVLGRDYPRGAGVESEGQDPTATRVSVPDANCSLLIPGLPDKQAGPRWRRGLGGGRTANGPPGISSRLLCTHGGLSRLLSERVWRHVCSARHELTPSK